MIRSGASGQMRAQTVDGLHVDLPLVDHNGERGHLLGREPDRAGSAGPRILAAAVRACSSGVRAARSASSNAIVNPTSSSYWPTRNRMMSRRRGTTESVGPFEEDDESPVVGLLQVEAG